jgi:hypothetical protein
LSKDTYRLPFKIGLTAAEQMLLIFSAIILDFEITVEAQNVHISEMQFLCMARKISK